MTIYSFFVPGAPQGKLRARTRAGFGFYTPKKTLAYEQFIRACFLLKYKHWPKIPACIPVSVNVNALFASPKKAKRTGPVLKKPDVDNIAKVVLDALNKCVWTDDAQVHGLVITKEYCSSRAPLVLAGQTAEISSTPGLVVRLYCNVKTEEKEDA